MSNSQENACEYRFGNKSPRFRPARAFFRIGLVALLVQSPVFATDPIDVDPDPDFASTAKTIFVDSSDGLDMESLAPGYYLIVVVGDDGSERSFEVRVD